MAELINSLRKLQDLDGQLYALRHQQRQKPLELEQVKQQVAQEQEVAKAADAKHKTAQLQQKEKEGELAAREGTVKKLQGQLFQVKTNKEYAAMQQEISQSKADSSLLEEAILKLIDEVEQAKQALQAQQKRVAERQDVLKREQARIDQDLAQITQQITRLEQERLGLTPALKREELSLYDRILVSREGLAMVPMVGQSCGGCNMVLPPQVINELSLGGKMTLCESCNRILYIEPS